MSTLTAVVREQRRALLRRDSHLTNQIVRDYQVARKAILKEAAALLAKIKDAQAAGTPISPSWLFRQARLKALQEQIEAEIAKFSEKSVRRIQAEQRARMEIGGEDAVRLAQVAMGPSPIGAEISFTKMPTAAVETIGELFGAGSPLNDLFDELGPQASKRARQVFVSGIARGHSVEKIAKALREAVDMAATRALTIARTEALRAYRESSRETYRTNQHVIKGWVWHASLSPATCASCWALHGSIHPIDEPMAEHPRGRCAMVPLTATWAELGFPGLTETRPEITPGPEVFARLSPEKQQQILGSRAAYEAYRDGEVTLQDFVGRHRSEKWGTTYSAQPLSRARKKPRRAA